MAIGNLRLILALTVTILLAPLGMAETGNRAAVDSEADTKNVHVLNVRGNVYMLVGAGCNITVQVGEAFVVVVDAGLPQFSDEVLATIRKLSSLPIMFRKYEFGCKPHRRECQACPGGRGIAECHDGLFA